MADVSTGTDRATLKALLKRSSEDKPARCAFAQPKDGAYALMVADKTKQPKALSSELEKAFAGAKNPRWGTAFADVNRLPPENGAVPGDAPDEKLLILMVNKPAQGLAMRLVKTLKLNKTGFSKVEVRYEDGSETERLGENDEEGDEAEASGPVAASAPPPDAASLRQALGGLIPRIAAASGADAGRKAEMMKLAGEANAALKDGMLAEASRGVRGLEALLNGGGNGVETATPPGAVAYAKSRLAWLAARKRMQSDVGALRTALAEQYQDDPGFGAQVEQAYNIRVAPLLEALDDELADRLDDAANAADPAKRAKLVDAAKAAIERYKLFLASDATIAALDSNPVAPLSLQKTMDATLAALAKAVR